MEYNFKTPAALLKMYKQGFVGSVCDEEDVKKLLGELSSPVFGAAAYSLYRSGEEKLSLPFKSLIDFDPEFGPSERQTTGDCGTYKNIEDVRVGDYVITHNNRSRRVYQEIKKYPHHPELLEIYIKKYDKTISVTRDHQFVVYSDYGYEWIKAEDLKEEDLLVLPKSISKRSTEYDVLDMSKYLDTVGEINENFIRNKNSKNKIPRYIPLSSDLMWLFGIYAAEGGLDGKNKERITFNLSSKEVEIQDRIQLLFKEIFGTGTRTTKLDRSKKGVVCIRCSNIVIARLFSDMVAGNQWSKSINDVIKNNTKDLMTQFVRGWIDGDGHLTLENRRKISGVSVSESLIKDISDILIKLQIQHTIHKREPRKRSKKAWQINLYGDQVYKVYPEHSCATKVHQKTRQNKLTCSLGLLAPITTINVSPHDDYVYCVNVEEDHSFIANGLAVHNCVSHATRNAIDITRAVEIKNGERESFIVRSATEGIYQSRGHRGQGMTCSGAARYVNQKGGILLRKDYGEVDLSTYDSSLGAKKQIPNRIYEDEAQKHQVKTISNIRTVEEARDALANGYAMSVCSGYGFSSRRDKNGIAKRSSGWAHAMAWIACDDTKNRLNETLFLVQNSWGAWNTGPKVHDQPDGSFWIREKDAKGMLSSGSAWVFSDVDGFPAREIKYSIGEVF